jgi:periplasmic protein TonB
MFEDSTFASTGRVKMRSRTGFLWAAAFEATIVLAAVLIPLLHPQALPNLFHTSFLEAPAPPMSAARMQARPAAPQARPAVLTFNPFEAPRVIPHGAYIPDKPETAGSFNPGDMDNSARSGGGGNNPFGPATPVAIVHPATPSVVRLPSKIVEGLLLHKTIPNYPQIAVSTRLQGTVVLQATISRTGTIENLRVLDGPPMLRQAALDAVSTWRYRPYMLNGQPIEVETTVNVVFRLGE